MPLAVLEIRVDGGDHPFDGAVELRLVDEGDPVPVPDRDRKHSIGNRLAQHRDDPLPELSGVVDFLLAVGGLDGGRGDDEEERLAFLNGPSDRLGEDLGIGDGLGVEPDVLAVCGERFAEPAYEVGVAP